MRDTFVEDRLPPPEQWPPLAALPDLPRTGPLNAATALVDARLAQGLGDAPAILTDDGPLTYAWLADTSARIAAVLADGGARPGTRVLLRGANSAWLFAAWAGVLRAGCVAVTTMPLLRAGEIAAILARASVGHAIVDAAAWDEFAIAAASAGTVVAAYTYGGGGPGSLEALAAAATPAAPAPTHADTPAILAFTSGTTGVPKACVHDHAAVLAPAHTFARHVLQPRAGDVHLCSAPIAFTFGLGALLLFPWSTGGACVPLASPTPAAMLDAVERHRVTTLSTAPTAYKTMLPLIAGRDLSSLTTCVSAGEHLPSAVSDAWTAATGLRPIEGIGATELMHIFISARDARPGWTGRAVPGFEACVLGADGAPLSEGIGRLAVRGPAGCRYLDDPRQADYVQDGWNITGDLFERDAEGWYRFVARADDMIVSSGYNIAAPEVEAALLAHPAVAECAVLAASCAERGQIVRALVVAAPGTVADPALARALQDHVKATIAPYKYPRALEFVDALPKTATGKLSRRALREIA